MRTVLGILARTFFLSGTVLLCGSYFALIYSIAMARLGLGGSAAAFVFGFVLLVMSEKE